mgnify:CR=1 FL=1|tara:strand:- start:1941 stop:2120 length:180 start_codon:yes stop_codon:yes gene_type:complete
MHFNWLHLAFIIAYFFIVLGVGLWISKLARNNLDEYLLGGKSNQMSFVGFSNASGMFDI